MLRLLRKFTEDILPIYGSPAPSDWPYRIFHVSKRKGRLRKENRRQEGAVRHGAFRAVMVPLFQGLFFRQDRTFSCREGEKCGKRFFPWNMSDGKKTGEKGNSLVVMGLFKGSKGVDLERLFVVIKDSARLEARKKAHAAFFFRNVYGGGKTQSILCTVLLPQKREQSPR